MINTSMAYKEAIESNREFGVSDRITFADGTVMTLTMGDYLAYSINEATSASGKFEIGAAVIKEYSATLKNDDGRFDAYDFEGADILSRISLKLADGTWETLQKGTYRITSAKATEMTIQIKAYDSMLFFDKPYSTSKLTYPATVNQIIQEACTSCQMTFDASTVEMGSYTVQTRPKADSLTYRDVISYCAQIMGCYARIDHLDKLSFGWYRLGDFEQYSDGGVFDEDTPYNSGDSVEGGNFDNYSSGDSVEGGNFDDLAKYHHFYNLGSQTINTDDIRITGIQVSAKGESSEEVESALYGTEGYVLEIADNPLIQVGAVDAVAQHVGPKLTGNTFRPLSITCQSDPSIESGDIALVTDRRQRTYQTVITNTTFALGGLQKVECTAETPTEKNYTKYGATTKLIAKVDDETDRKLSAYDIAVQNMNQMAANTLGFYATTIRQTDGSVLAYRHDKPKLKDSKIVYKSGIDGFWVTQNYTGDDDTTAWKAGFDSNGNAVLNILSAIGINFSWARGGTLTLGGSGNEYGAMNLVNSNGELDLTLNNRGLFTHDEGVIIRNGGGITTKGAGGDKVEIAAGYLRLTKSLDEWRGNGIYMVSADNTLNSQYCLDGIELGGYFYIRQANLMYYKGNLRIDGEIINPINTVNYSTRSMNTYTTPSAISGDGGEGMTDETGRCYVTLDDIFQEAVNTYAEYQVFLQKEGQGDLWVEEKSSAYFIVRGTPGLKFAWKIEAKRLDMEYNRLEELEEK